MEEILPLALAGGAKFLQAGPNGNAKHARKSTTGKPAIRH